MFVLQTTACIVVRLYRPMKPYSLFMPDFSSSLDLIVDIDVMPSTPIMDSCSSSVKPHHDELSVYPIPISIDLVLLSATVASLVHRPELLTLISLDSLISPLTLYCSHLIQHTLLLRSFEELSKYLSLSYR